MKLRQRHTIFFKSIALFKRTRELKKLFLAVFSVFLFSGCPQVPSDLDFQVYVHSLNVVLIYEKDSSLTLQVPKEKDFSLFVKIEPKEFNDSLKYSWFSNDSLISNKRIFEFKKNYNLIPDSVLIKDNAGNFLGNSFNITFNSKPVIEKILHPTPQDTLYGDSKEPFLFSWKSYDADKDTLFFFLKTESKTYPVGIWEYAHISGFEEGEHKFKIIAEDSKGSKDSTDWFTFYVKENKP